MRKRSVELNGRKTGVSLEDDFWHALKEIAAAQNISVQDLILKIDNERTHAKSIIGDPTAHPQPLSRTMRKPRQQAGRPMRLGNRADGISLVSPCLT